MPSRFLLALIASALTLACSTGRSGDPDGGGGGLDGARVDGGGARCVDGERRCVGNNVSECVDGVYRIQETCGAEEACSIELGCTACEPGGRGCLGDSVVRCDASGNPTDEGIENCDGQTCIRGQCADPCSEAALSRSYSGCVFWAVDLPQEGIETGFSSIAATQPFAVAIANPWEVPITARVERDDGPVGGAGILNTVTERGVPALSIAVIELPQREVDGWTPSMDSRSRLSHDAYRVTTDRPATVYQFNPIDNPDSYSNDATLLIPENALDESYVVLGWPGIGRVSFGGLPSPHNRPFITIVASRPETRVRVIPSTHVMAGDGVTEAGPGEEMLFTLGAFGTLNLMGADTMPIGPVDFTGTVVEATGPIAVFSGVECITIAPEGHTGDSCCCDHLEHQLFPRSTLAREYAVVRSHPRGSEPDVYRVMAIEDGTSVTTTLGGAHASFTLNRGEYRRIDATSDFLVTATEPIVVGQFLVSQQVTDRSTGDPAFIMVPPRAQYRDDYVFLVPSGYAENHVQLAMPVGVEPRLDGGPVTCTRAPLGELDGTTYEAVRCPVSEGIRRLVADEPFGLTVIGYGPGPVSYGYTGGMDFSPVNIECVEPEDCPGGEFCSGGNCTTLF